MEQQVSMKLFVKVKEAVIVTFSLLCEACGDVRYT